MVVEYKAPERKSIHEQVGAVVSHFLWLMESQVRSEDSIHAAIKELNKAYATIDKMKEEMRSLDSRIANVATLAEAKDKETRKLAEANEIIDSLRKKVLILSGNKSGEVKELEEKLRNAHTEVRSLEREVRKLQRMVPKQKRRPKKEKLCKAIPVEEVK